MLSVVKIELEFYVYGYQNLMLLQEKKVSIRIQIVSSSVQYLSATIFYNINSTFISLIDTFLWRET